MKDQYKSNSTSRTNQPYASHKDHGAKLSGRSAITNGTDLLPDIDGRSIWARRYRDLIQLHLADKGGASNVSEAQLALIRRAAAVTVELERRESEFARDGKAKGWKFDDYLRAVGVLRRLLQTLGLDRVPRRIDATHSIISAIRGGEFQ